MIKTLIATVFFLAATTASVAQQNPSEIPKAHMDQLSTLVGSFMTTMEYSPDGGTTWQVMAPKKVDITMRQKGLMMAEIPADTSAPGFHMENYLTYDQYRKVYRKAAIDDTWGIMDLYEGTIEDGKLILTNLKSGTTFPTQNGERFFKLKIDLNEGERWMNIDASEDGGKSWAPNFRVKYVPVE